MIGLCFVKMEDIPKAIKIF